MAAILSLYPSKNTKTVNKIVDGVADDMDGGNGCAIGDMAEEIVEEWRKTSLVGG